MNHRKRSTAGLKVYNKIVSRQLARIRQLSADNSAIAADCQRLSGEKERNQLMIAEYKAKLNALRREYESLCNTKSWLYTAPIRKFLDKAIKVPLKARHSAEYLSRFVATFRSLSGFPCNDWVETVNRHKGSVAVVQTAIEGSDFVSQQTINLAEYLVQNGYLVIFVYLHVSSMAKQRQIQDKHPDIIKITNHEFVSQAAKLHPGRDGSLLCFIAAPARNLVEQLPVIRSAGFAIVVEIVRDWEASHANGQAEWYEKASEEQVVLSADLIVVSASLKHKFAHLRRDIVSIDGHDAAAGDNLGTAAKQCEQLLKHTTRKMYMRNIYA